MNSVYIHIPFCNSICSYCDFCKVLYNRKWTISYLEALKKEVRDNYDGELLKSIYIGGGTPSTLTIHELNLLFEIIEVFNVDIDYEFTMECNITDITANLLNYLKEKRVNRLSIGIQSFNEEKLKEMDRPYTTYKDALEKINLCRNIGFDNINLDFMYGFKDESLLSIKNDLDLLISLKPEHLSTYSLIVSENTMLKISKYERLDDDKDAKIYEYITKRLKKKGYTHYEVSNFSKSGYESIHNLNYWNNGEYYGFGLGASGNKLGLRYDNTKSLTEYLNGITKTNSCITSRQENMEYELMLGLRKIQGINLQNFYNKYNVNVQDVFPIQELVNNKELIYKDGYIFIPKDKLYIMNEILVKLL